MNVHVHCIHFRIDGHWPTLRMPAPVLHASATSTAIPLHCMVQLRANTVVTIFECPKHKLSDRCTSTMSNHSAPDCEVAELRASCFNSDGRQMDREALLQQTDLGALYGE